MGQPAIAQHWTTQPVPNAFTGAAGQTNMGLIVDGHAGLADFVYELENMALESKFDLTYLKKCLSMMPRFPIGKKQASFSL